MRTKLGVIDNKLTPTAIWRDVIRAALPYAEKYNVIMQPEIHAPTRLTDPLVQEYVEFIEKEKTPYFGLNIDFGTFGVDNMPSFIKFEPSKPEDIIPLLPYVHCCHAKYYNMNDDFDETYIPYRQIIKIMQDHGWNGYLLSEYEGPHKEDYNHCMDQVKRHHIMLKNILGE